MIKVAFCTQDGRHVNRHFGQTRRFAIYGYDGEAFLALPDAITGGAGPRTSPPPLPHEHDKIALRLNAISDCMLVYSTRIGDAAAARLTARRIMPIQVEDGTGIQQELDKLLALLQNNPPPWLAKGLKPLPPS